MQTVILWIAIAGLSAGFGVTTWLLLSMLPRFERIESALAEERDDSALTQFRERCDELTIAVAHGIEHVDRAERRVQTTLRSAHSKFAKGGYEDPNVDAEIANLPDVDGEGGGGEQLSLLPDEVALPAADNSPSGIPGMTVDQANAIRAARAESA